MPEKREPETYAGLISHLVSFITVAIHTILYERNVYPQESFLTARAYNFPVRQSRHPTVCKWINDAIDAVQTQLLQGQVDKVSVVIIHPDTYAPLERFMFDLSKLMAVSADDANTPFIRAATEGNDHSSKGKASAVDTHKEWVDLDEQLRAVMSKLSVCGTTLKAIPEGCTFTVAIELKEEGKAPIAHPQAFIPAEPSSQRSVLSGTDTDEQSLSGHSSNKRIKEGQDTRGVRTIPVRSIEAGELMFDVWIEEGRAKTETDIQSSGTDANSSAS